jgi:hypothetical protein
VVGNPTKTLNTQKTKLSSTTRKNMELTDIERGDTIRVVHDEDDWPETYEVMDTEFKDIGIAGIVVVALVAGCDRYTLRKVGGNKPKLKHEAGAETELDYDAVDVFDPEA